MITLEKIKSALESQRQEIESDCFCSIALTGGYENVIRDILYEGLTFIGDTQLKVEHSFQKIDGHRKRQLNRIDLISGDPANLNYLIELGHNGTWQNPFSVINHAIDDINRSFEFSISSKERYIVSILTNILDFKEEEAFRLRQSYLNGIIANKKSPFKKLNETRAFFKKLDSFSTATHIEIPKFSPSIWKGFQIDIHIFVAGSFEREIPKSKVRKL